MLDQTSYLGCESCEGGRIASPVCIVCSSDGASPKPAPNRLVKQLQPIKFLNTSHFSRVIVTPLAATASKPPNRHISKGQAVVIGRR